MQLQVQCIQYTVGLPPVQCSSTFHQRGWTTLARVASRIVPDQIRCLRRVSHLPLALMRLSVGAQSATSRAPASLRSHILEGLDGVIDPTASIACPYDALCLSWETVSYLGATKGRPPPGADMSDEGLDVT